MANQENEIPVRGIDTKALSSLIIELNISRRNCRSYPKGHPLIDSSLQKVLNIYGVLMQTHQEIVIGVTRDALLVEGVFLDKTNLIYRDFAGTLFEQGIGVLILRHGLTMDELKKFIIILNLKREENHRYGGIEAIWEKSRIAAIGIRAIRYDLFSTQDETHVGKTETPRTTEGLWEQFARGLAWGIINQDDSTENLLDPELLAAVLNSRFAMGSDGSWENIRSIIDFLCQEEASQPLGSHSTVLPYEKIAAFVSNLNPNLRCQFLGSAFDMRSAGNQAVAEGVINHLSSDTVLETLEEVNRSDIALPPVIMGLLQRLSKQTTAGRYAIAVDEPDNDDYHQKVRTIFREHAAEDFIPDAYQQKLNQIIADEQMPLLIDEDVHDLIDTFDASGIENRISEILLFLFMDDPTAENNSGLVGSLNDMSAYFLQTGDYTQVLRIIRQVKDDRIPTEIRQDLLKPFAQRLFLEEVLCGLHTWGKAKYAEIGQIIREVGEPFIDILIDRLAEEESLSLRRFLMERIQEFGPAASASIGDRLSDSRWYFLRNLIVLVRTINDRSLLDKVQPLVRHANQRVRLEALRTLLHMNDRTAERQILRDMENDDHDVVMTAVRLAEKSTSPEVFSKLLSILTKSGLSKNDFELKSTVVKALAEIGNDDALPCLSRILASRNIIHPRLLARLKLDIISSLELYPSQAAHDILKRCSSGRGSIARHAELSLTNASRRRP